MIGRLWDLITGRADRERLARARTRSMTPRDFSSETARKYHQNDQYGR